MEVFIKGFPKSWKEEDLRKLLQYFGGFQRLNLARNNRGFAFVTYDSPEAGKRVCDALDGVEVEEGCILSARSTEGSGAKRDPVAIRFPQLSPEQQARIRLDRQAEYSVTEQPLADNLSRLIRTWMGREDLIITDGCAGGGGNVLSFAKHFKSVNAIEIDRSRCSDLKNNVEVCGLSEKVTCYNKDYYASGLWRELRQDVIFMDPPWGGPEYNKEDTVPLFLTGAPIGKVVQEIHLARAARLTVLKVPYNFDVRGFMRDLHAEATSSSSSSSSTSSSTSPSNNEAATANGEEEVKTTASSSASSSSSAPPSVDRPSRPHAALLTLAGWLYIFLDHEVASREVFERKLSSLPSHHLIKYTLDATPPFEKRRLQPFKPPDLRALAKAATTASTSDSSHDRKRHRRSRSSSLPSSAAASASSSKAGGSSGSGNGRERKEEEGNGTVRSTGQPPDKRRRRSSRSRSHSPRAATASSSSKKKRSRSTSRSRDRARRARSSPGGRRRRDRSRSYSRERRREREREREGRRRRDSRSSSRHRRRSRRSRSVSRERSRRVRSRERSRRGDERASGRERSSERRRRSSKSTSRERSRGRERSR